MALVAAAVTVAPLAAQTGRDTTRQAAPVQQGYGAWFGSIPDMTDTERGVLLEGVSAGSPAYEAGLLKGDRILMMAGDTVRDLRDMVTVLRDHEPGETIEVVFVRKGAAQKAKVTLGLRPPG